MKFKNTIKNCKRRGEWAELEFMAAAAKHGLEVFNPRGDSATYDAVVETRGHFVRVQVNSTTALRPEGCYRCNIRPASGLPYKRGDFDFIAVYVIPEDVWYIIPARLVVAGNKRTAIVLYTNNLTGRWAPYREAWHLLRDYHRTVAPNPTRISEDEHLPGT
jgi:PD-(D/E)XK nuclease superfamily protein